MNRIKAIALILFFPSVLVAGEIHIDGIRVLGNIWFTVKNPDGISNSNHRFHYGDLCRSDVGDSLLVVSSWGDTILVSVKKADLIRASHRKCPDKTVTTVSARAFFKMMHVGKPVGDNRALQEEREREKIRKVLKEKGGRR